MRLKIIHLFEIIITISFPFVIYSQENSNNNNENNNESENSENECNIYNFFEKNCVIDFKSDEEKKLFMTEFIAMIHNNTLPEILEYIDGNNKQKNIIGENTIYNIFKLNKQEINENFTYIRFQDSINIILGDSLFVFKIENKVPPCKIPFVDYILFTRDASDDFENNLYYYNNYMQKLYYYIPVNINVDELYLYNKSDNYYKEECKVFKSKNGTDIPLYSRKKFFNTRFLSPCENNCQFEGYVTFYDTPSFKCECNIKEDLVSITELNYMALTNESSLLYQFDIEPKLTNFDVIKCYYLIASVDYITKNPGFYLLSLILLFLFIIIFIFIFKGYNSLSQRIDEAIKMKFHPELDVSNKNLIVLKIKIKHKNSSRIKKNKNKRSKSTKNMNRDMKKTKTINIRGNRGNSVASNNNMMSNKNSDPKNQLTKVDSLGQLNKENDGNAYTFENDYELNNISFQQAIKIDNREFCDLYRSLIKNKQLIMFSFFDFNSYNSPIIKKTIFFLSFIYHYGFNAFFFTDEILDTIFEEEGKYNPLVLVPLAVYSAMITTVFIKLLVDFLVLTEKQVLRIKNEETEEKANDEKKRLLKITIIKLCIFFSINIILLIFFWFYLTCFNAVYPNTQIFLVINTAISFVISNIIPLIYNLIPAFIRNDILTNKNIKKMKSKKKSSEFKDAEYVYSIGLFLQKF
jgi:hypothetical protein